MPEERMSQTSDDIVVPTERVEPEILRRLVKETFVDMVKYVVDVERGVVAVGGQLHADAEQRLLELGSHQEDLWGANYYPGRGVDGCIEFTSLINIRPAEGNPGMVVEDPGIRDRIRAITFVRIGRGEPLP
jgi:hypothetical protein